MKKLSKRQQEIVDKLNSGYILNTGADNGWGKPYCSLVHKDMPDEPLQLAFFWRMVNENIIYQRLGSPFDFILMPDYNPNFNHRKW